ncbi:MAG: hypothetical protein ACP5L0_07780, partial [Caldisphaera sp.]
GTYNISYGTFNTGQVNFSLAISGNGINVNLGDYSINSNELDNNLYEMILSTLFNPITLNSGNYNLIISGIDNSIYNLSLIYNTSTNDYIYEIGYYQVNTQNISFYEKGLPSGTQWYVYDNLGNLIFSITSNSFTFQYPYNPNANYLITFYAYSNNPLYASYPVSFYSYQLNNPIIYTFTFGFFANYPSQYWNLNIPFNPYIFFDDVNNFGIFNISIY